MNVPVPRNRLVALTVFGVVLTGVVSATLASPTLLLGDGGATDDAGQDSNALASDAPTPNENFTPAVQSQGGGEENGEYEEEGYEDHEEGERYEESEESEEHEDEYEEDEREDHD